MNPRLLIGATSQYIDANGKMRMLNYGNDLSLMTSPLPPVDLPEDANIRNASFSFVEKFLERTGLEIKEQDQVGSKIQGIWLIPSPPLFYAYIPTDKKTNAISDVPAAPPELNDPMRTDKGKSELDILRENEKKAEMLKIYTLYAYSLSPEKYSDLDKVFTIDPDVKYNDLRNVLDVSSPFLDSKKRVRVPNEDIRNRLRMHLQVSLLNDRPGVLALKYRKRNDKYYTSVNDFRSVNGMVFTNRESLVRWLNNERRIRDALTVQTTLLPSNIEPYFYRNAEMGERVYLVQNADSSDGKGLERAVSLAYKWSKDMVNLGYECEIIENINNISYTVHNPDGSEKEHVKKDKNFAHIFEYSNGEFAALLY